MGKYMRKAKLAGEIAAMEITHQSSLGVRTRARTLALQRLQKLAPSSAAQPDAGSYLQLRNRRLEKAPACRPKDGHKTGTTAKAAAPEVEGPKPMLAAPSSVSGSFGSASAAQCCCSKKGAGEEELDLQASTGSEGVEASFGENVLELEARERSVRETTPCSLLRDSEATGTPRSTTRTRTTSNRRTHNAAPGNVPTPEEMEEFFAAAEQLQGRIFTEKYNFDPVNECPLPGRYEWVRLDC